MNEELKIEEPLPHWAKKTADTYELFACLATKNGRVIGNGLIFDIEYSVPIEIFTVITDAGNISKFSHKELQELFYFPLWVSKVPMPHLIPIITTYQKRSSQSTKQCPKCGSNELVCIATQNTKICTNCFDDKGSPTKIPWFKDEGQDNYI